MLKKKPLCCSFQVVRIVILVHTVAKPEVINLLEVRPGKYFLFDLFSINICFTLSLFYKQPAYKHLALGWQIAKQLSGLNPISLSSSKSGLFPLQ